MKIGTRDLALIAIFAALYATLVYVFAFISFMALQFRVAGLIRPAIAKKWILSIGYGLGVVVANVFSPFGVYDTLFMPFMSFVAGLLGYVVARRFNKNYFVCGAVIATVIPLSLSWMFSQLFGAPILANLPPILIAEQIICFIGSIMFMAIDTRFKWWQK